MPLQNRVTPLGELIAHPARGLVYGNRGCLHDAEGRIRRRYAVKRWIACRLEFRGRRRSPLMQPGRYTELFFLDEATAMAAGHRACAECRRADYDRLVEIWRELHPGQAGADAIDAQLHSERLGSRPEVPLDELPDGAFVLREGVRPLEPPRRKGSDPLSVPDSDLTPWLVRGGELLRWTPAGYDARVPRSSDGRAVLLTPPSLIAVLRAGWAPLVPLLHPSAV